MRLALPEYNDGVGEASVAAGSSELKTAADDSADPPASDVSAATSFWLDLSLANAAAPAAATVWAHAAVLEAKWEPAGAGNLRHWCRDTARMFLWQEDAEVLFECLAGTGATEPSGKARHVALWAARGPTCVLSRLDAPEVSRVVDSNGILVGHEENAGVWTLSGYGVAATHLLVQPDCAGRWWLQVLPGAPEALVDGERVAAPNAATLRHGSIVRVGVEVEVRVDIPDWPGSPAAAAASARDNAAAASSTSDTVTGGSSDHGSVQRSFVPAGAEPLKVVQLSGKARAHELNRALKRALCRGVTTSEREGAARREAQYEDRAAKRQRLHPVDWSETRSEVATLEKAMVEQAKADEEAPWAARMQLADAAGTMCVDGSFAGRVVSRPGLGYVDTAGASRPSAASMSRRFAEHPA
eukprot:TRINITY_DN22289_c0_g1_i8.p1 TRINITY_DN22289_c0_g1~~TRINITY_DN22289_c0_g1_i8.p1  ORF type:complete len:413 (+),score=65.14 TRINITY_DN22289_c0_g1_i8:287-1525(+)